MCFRERANLQLANRRLERKVKEMVMQGEEEQHSLQDQKDQVRHHTSPPLWLSLTFQSFHNEPNWMDSSSRPRLARNLAPVIFSLQAESPPEGLEASDGRGRRRDRPTGARQEEAAEGPWRAAGGQRAAAEPTQSAQDGDQVNNPNQQRIGALEKQSWVDHLSEPLTCLVGARAAQPRCWTRCTTTTMTTTMTSAPMERRISAQRRATSAPPVRRTSCPPSLCEQEQSHSCRTKQCRVLHPILPTFTENISTTGTILHASVLSWNHFCQEHL